MAHLGFICPPLAGHINPMAVLARELRRRGHSVVFLGFPDMRARLPLDLESVSFGAADQPAGSLQPYLDRLSRLGTLRGVRRLIGDLAGFAETTCQHLPLCLNQVRPDALVIDQTDVAASLVARGLGVPFVTVANALPMNPEPGVPPPVLAWPYDPSPRGVRRNIGGYRIASLIERPVTEVIRGHARRFGLSEIRFGHETWSDRCQLTQCIEPLDFPRRALPEKFHYLGPFREEEDGPAPELAESGRPLVFCSLGSLQGARARLFHRIAAAADDLGVDLVIAHGGNLPDDAVRAFPGRPQVHAFVPQRMVLARSTLAVTHGGFNTVLDALSSGTPMIALPIAFEQPGTAARLARCGVAEAIHRGRTRSRIRSAMARVLADGSFAANARRLAQNIADAGGVRRAADLIEQACGLCARPEAATTASLG